MKNIVASIAASAVVLSLAFAAEAQDAPSSYVCEFTGGQAWSYTAGTFQSKPPQPLSFTIENVDLEKQTAVLKAKSGGLPGKLSVVRAINANHFIEAVNEGFLNLTTIYDKDPATGTYPAVHSRHFGILGQPVFGQYTGSCRPE
jgi:hypothetical protein